MKSFVVALVIAAIMVGGSMLYTHHIDRLSENMLAANDRIIEYIMQDDYDEAANEVKELVSYLDDKKFSLAATINHESLDNIDIHVSQLEKYVQCGQKADSLANCQVLDVLFKHLPKNYKLKIENIL